MQLANQTDRFYNRLKRLRVMPVKEDPSQKPFGVYVGALYFVMAGFLNAIQTFRKWGSPVVLNPLEEHSLWHLAANVVVYLAAAYLLWRLTHWGRLLGLVYAYLTLLMNLGVVVLFSSGKIQALPPLFAPLAAFDLVALVPLIFYLQPSLQKATFNVSLVEVLLPPE